jgi:hypothetical protein
MHYIYSIWARTLDSLGAEAAEWLVSLYPDEIKSIGGIIIGRGRPKYSDKEIPQCHCKFHMDCPGIKSNPLPLTTVIISGSFWTNNKQNTNSVALALK